MCSSDIVDAIKRARAKRRICLNFCRSLNSFWKWLLKTFCWKSDYGWSEIASTVGDSISVASINNNVITTEVFEVKVLESNAEADNGKFVTVICCRCWFWKGKGTNMSVGLGKKISKKTWTLPVNWPINVKSILKKKIANAFHHGAAGALVYNVEGSNLGMAIDGDAKNSITSSFQNAMGDS